jgi:glycosyltransferase involved in cell wall biosynthesis
LRIAIFHFGFFYSGGGEKLVLEEVRGLRELGHEVECFAPYVDKDRCFPDYPEIKQVRRLLPHPPQWLPLNHAIWVLACCLLIPFMARRFVRFDVLVGANQPAPWLAFVVGNLLRKPYVVYLAQPLRLLHPRKVDEENGLRIRDGDQDFVRLVTRFAGRLIDWADRLSLRSANAVLTNGRHVDEWIADVYGIPSIVCAAGCHPANRRAILNKRPESGQFRIDNNLITKPFMLLSNRHSPMKRFEYALWALKKILREMDAVTLVITGQETEYTAQLRYLADSLQIQHRVNFVGLVSESDLRLLYSEASLYIYTSPEEDFGMGIIEAMACGAPVVAWNAGGPMESVSHGETGFLVRPYDVDEFADRMLRILRDRNLAHRMGVSGYARAAECFSFERHNRQIEHILLQTVSSALSENAVQLSLPYQAPIYVGELASSRVDDHRSLHGKP